MVDASADEAILSRSYNKTYEIIERIARNNYQLPTNQPTTWRRVTRVHKDALTSLLCPQCLRILLLKGSNNSMSGQ